MPWTLTRDLVGADADRRAAIIRGGIVANLGIAALIGLVLLGLYIAGPMRTGLESLPVLAAVIAALPLISLASVWRAASQGHHAFGRVGIIQGVEVTGKTAVGLALAVAGFGAAGAVAGFAAGGLLAAIVGALLVGRLVSLRGRGVVWPRLATIGPMFGALLALALLLNLDLIAMKLLSTDREATGHYQAAIILANAPFFLVSSAVVPVLFTRLADAVDLRATRVRVAEALRFAFVLVLPIELVLIAIPDVIVGWLFPPAYAVAAPIIRLMAIGNSLLMIVAVLGAAHQAVGRAGDVGRVLMSVAGVEAIALLWLVPRFGALGAVLAFDMAALVSSLLLGARYVARTGIAARAAGPWLGRWAIALGIGGAVALLALATAGAGVALLAAGVVYYALVLVLRLVPEIRLAWPGGRPTGAGGGAGGPASPVPGATSDPVVRIATDAGPRRRVAPRPAHEER